MADISCSDKVYANNVRLESQSAGAGYTEQLKTSFFASMVRENKELLTAAGRLLNGNTEYRFVKMPEGQRTSIKFNLEKNIHGDLLSTTLCFLIEGKQSDGSFSVEQIRLDLKTGAYQPGQSSSDVYSRALLKLFPNDSDGFPIISAGNLVPHLAIGHKWSDVSLEKFKDHFQKLANDNVNLFQCSPAR